MTETLFMEHPQPAAAAAASDLKPIGFGEPYPLPIPPLDPLYFSGPEATNGNLTSDLDLLLDEDDGFDFDFDFDVDGLDGFDFPLDTEATLISADAQEQTLHPDAGFSETPGDRVTDNVHMYMDCVSSEIGNYNRGSEEGSGDRCSDSDRTMNRSSPASSQGSGHCCVGASEAIKESSPASTEIGFEQKVDLKMIDKSYVSRKKKKNEDPNAESRSCKFSRSADAAGTNGEDEKRKLRLMRNRESAQLSRERKRQYVEELEGKLKAMHSTITELNCKMSYIISENAALRHQLIGGAAFYPPPVMPYGWVPRNAVKPHGLVAIPKMKTQEPKRDFKAKRSDKRSKTKRVAKVAGISFLGLLFFMFLFGGFLPFVNVSYGGKSESTNGGSTYVSEVFHDQLRRKETTVNRFDGSDSSSCTSLPNGNFDSSYIVSGYGGLGHHSLSKDQGERINSSEPMFASLYVPRNDKLVKIDGNLIIHSALASEKAVASEKSAPEINDIRRTDSRIHGELSSALAIPDIEGSEARLPQVYPILNQLSKSLPSGSADRRKLHQWFREDGTGSMLDSAVCTEVYEFDVASPIPIAHSSSISNTSANDNDHHNNQSDAAHAKKTQRNRRILQGLPITLTGSDDLNRTRDEKGENQKKENDNKTGSSMVVSVLVDPRDTTDAAGFHGLMGSAKSITKIFVVLLVDRVKYVTYSCVLPRSDLHLVSS